jgi:4-amino-4-deoxy-L-arabinose transferase-like glycosyltransferase
MSLGRARTDPVFPWIPLAVILTIVGASVAVSLGARDVWAPDEPRYALVAREMIETGEFLIPHLNGEVYPDKPPLLFWSIALASQLTGGVNQPAAVLPPLLAMLLALAGTARLAWLLGGRRDPLVPLLAAGLLGISYRFALQGGFGQIDMLLCACTTWAFSLLLEGVGWDTGREPRPGRVTAAYALMGLGILAKGPVALILPLGGFLLGSLLAGRRKLLLSALHPLGWVALVLLVGAWLVPAAVHALNSGQEAWLTNVLFKQTAVRYAASWEHHRPFWYMFVVPLYDFRPTIWLLPGAAWSLWRRREDGAERATSVLLAAAFLFVIVFFSIPSGKRGLYLLPGYPLLAVWVARDLAARLRGTRPLRGPRLAAGIVAVIALASLGGLFLLLPEELAERGLDVPLWPLGAALGLIAAAGTVAAWRPGELRAWAGVGLAWAVLWGVAYGVVLPAADPLKSARELARDVRAGTVDEAKGGIVDFRARFGYHLGRLDAVGLGDREGLRRLASELDSDQPRWVIVRADHLESLERWLDEDAAVVTIDRDRIGDKDYRVLANRAALVNGGRTAPGAR